MAASSLAVVVFGVGSNDVVAAGTTPGATRDGEEGGEAAADAEEDRKVPRRDRFRATAVLRRTSCNSDCPGRRSASSPCCWDESGGVEAGCGWRCWNRLRASRRFTIRANCRAFTSTAAQAPGATDAACARDTVGVGAACAVGNGRGVAVDVVGRNKRSGADVGVTPQLSFSPRRDVHAHCSSPSWHSSAHCPLRVLFVHGIVVISRLGLKGQMGQRRLLHGKVLSVWQPK